MACDHLNGGLHLFIREQGAWQRRCLMCGVSAPASAPDFPEAAGDAAALGFLRHEQRRFDEAAAAFKEAFALCGDPRCLYAALLCRLGVVFCGDEQQPTFYAASMSWQRLAEMPAWREIELSRERLSPYAFRAMAAQANQLEEMLQCIRSREGLSACDVFLCYRRSRENIHRALALYRELKKQGLRVFCADVTTRGKTQEQFEAEVYHALHTAEYLVLLPGEGADALTPWLQNELERSICPKENRFLCSDGRQALPAGLGQAMPMEEIERRLSRVAGQTGPEELFARGVSALENDADNAFPLLRRAGAAGSAKARLLLAQLYEEGFLIPQSDAAAAHYRRLAGKTDLESCLQVYETLNCVEQLRGISRQQALIYVAADVSDAGLALSRAMLRQLFGRLGDDRRLAGAQVCLVGYDRHARVLEQPRALSWYGAPELAVQRLCAGSGTGQDHSAYAAKGVRCAADHLLHHPQQAGCKPLLVLLKVSSGDAPGAVAAALQCAQGVFCNAQDAVIDSPAQIPGCMAALLRALD